MGRRGPAPTPSPILKLRGTARNDRIRNEPKAPSERPKCPDWLDDEAKAAWKWLVPKLEQMGVLSTVDRNALARYCQLWSRWKRAEQFIQEHGEVYPLRAEDGSVKYLQQLPQVAIAHNLAMALTRLEQEFGMTPSSRSRIQVPQGQRDAGHDKGRFFNTA